MSSNSETSNKPMRTAVKTPTKVESPKSEKEEKPKSPRKETKEESSDSEVVIKTRKPQPEVQEESEDSTPISKAKTQENVELPAEKKRDGPDYKTLWADAVKLGLIPEDMKESKPSYRFIINYTMLKEKMEEFKALEEGDKPGQTASFKALFGERKKENKRLFAEKKKSAKKSTKKNKADSDDDKPRRSRTKSTNKKRGDSSDDDKPRKPRSKSTHRKGRDSDESPKGTHKKGTHKKGTHKKAAGEKEGSDKLMKLWEKYMEAGLIDEDYSFHRGIPDFITMGELKALYKQYKGTDKKGKTKISNALNADIKSFNSMSHPVSGFFRVFRTYEVLWKEAVKLDLIDKSVIFNPDYAEWLDPKTLTAYMQTAVQVPDLVKPLSGVITSRIKNGGKFIKKAAQIKEMDMKDLVTEAKRKEFLSDDAPCVDSKKCLSKVDERDFRTAFFSFLKMADEEEAEKRKARWTNYMAYLSE